jgi:hypothetical protein
MVSNSGCAGSSSSVEIELPEGREIAPNGSILIKATFSDQGTVPEEGSDASFTTTVGSFDLSYLEKQTDVEIMAGQAEARLYSFGGESGSGKVTVSFVNNGGQDVSASVDVEISGGQSKPSASGFSISCPSKNVCVYDECADTRNLAKFRCTVTVKDKNGQNIPNANVSLLIEHKVNGTPCSKSVVDDPETPGIDFDITPDCDPMDVPPIETIETQDYQYFENNVIHNPRDGVLTIVAYTQGEEGYTDTNSNGTYDPGEFFFDLAEPFVDANDSNTMAGDGRDDGESYIDADWGTDGQWDMPNGVWDSDTLIWTSTHILLTGTPHPATTRYFPGLCVPSGNNLTLNTYLVDINTNPIAANTPGSDEIYFEIESNYNDTLNDTSYLKNSLGMTFNDWGYLSQILDDDRTYQVVITDDNPNDGEGAWILTPYITFTPYMEADEIEIYLDSITGSSGSCN